MGTNPEWSPQFLDLDPVHARGSRYSARARNQVSSCIILCSYEFVSVVHRKILRRFLACGFQPVCATEPATADEMNREMKASWEMFLRIVRTANARGELWCDVDDHSCLSSLPRRRIWWNAASGLRDGLFVTKFARRAAAADGRA